MAEVVGSIPIAPTKIVVGGSFAIRRQQLVHKDLRPRSINLRLNPLYLIVHRIVYPDGIIHARLSLRRRVDALQHRVTSILALVIAHQRVVAAHFEHPALIHEDNSISPTNSRKAVSDDNHQSVF